MTQFASHRSVTAPASPRHMGAALLLAGLLAALTAIGSGLAARFFPGWRPGFLPLACFLVAVEAALVRYRMLQGRYVEVGALPYLAAELFSLAVLMRVVATLSAGINAAPWGLEHYLRYPLAAVDAPFVGCCAAGLAVALLVRAGLKRFAELDPRLPISETGLDGERFRSIVAQDEREALGQLGSGLGWGGALALLGLVGQVVNISRVGAPALPLPPASALAGIVYLICGVLLYSWGRLGLLQARWSRDALRIEPAVARRWRWASLGLVLAVACAGLLLPGGYGTGLLALAQGALVTLVNLLSLVALFFGAIAIGAFGLVLTIPAMLLALLPRAAPVVGEPTPPQLPAPPPPPAPMTNPPLGPGIVFWLCVALLAGYALWTVIRRQEWAIALATRLRQGVFAPILAWLQSIWVGARAYAQAVGETLAERLRPAPPAPAAPPRLHLRSLSPGELVRYFYRATLERAERGGLGRAPSETPYEYGSRLRAALPDEAEAVDGLTDSYIATAYGPHAATGAEARRARGLWARLKRALREPR